MKKQTVSPAGQMALFGVLAALTAALSALESWLPPLPVPMARFGLSNLTVMLAAWSLGPYGAVAMGVVKVALALWMRGTTAALLAGCGTALSVGMTLLLLPLVRRECISFVGVSVAAAGAHTIGQLCCATVMLSPAVWSYGALLMTVSAVSGTLMGLVLNAVVAHAPHLNKRILWKEIDTHSERMR